MGNFITMQFHTAMWLSKLQKLECNLSEHVQEYDARGFDGEQPQEFGTSRGVSPQLT